MGERAQKFGDMLIVVSKLISVSTLERPEYKENFLTAQ